MKQCLRHIGQCGTSGKGLAQDTVTGGRIVHVAENHILRAMIKFECVRKNSGRDHRSHSNRVAHEDDAQQERARAGNIGGTDMKNKVHNTLQGNSDQAHETGKREQSADK